MSITGYKHGHATRNYITKTYHSWAGMCARCRNKNNIMYQRYGARGITVCSRWLSFENFLADMGEKPAGTSLDRKDNDGNYCPENCRWATRNQQNRNRRSNRLLTYDGVTKCLVEWAETIGISKRTLANRVNRGGWSVEKALTTPARRRKISLDN